MLANRCNSFVISGPSSYVYTLTYVTIFQLGMMGACVGCCSRARGRWCMCRVLLACSWSLVHVPGDALVLVAAGACAGCCSRARGGSHPLSIRLNFDLKIILSHQRYNCVRSRAKLGRINL